MSHFANRRAWIPAILLMGIFSSPQLSLIAEETGTTSRKVDVTDVIEMAKAMPVGDFGDDQMAAFSPNRQWFVVIIKKANLRRNTNDFSLLLFHVHDVEKPFQPKVLITMASRSNRDGIRLVRWLGDNRTLVFIGEGERGRSAVYALNTVTRILKQLTQHSTPVVGYDIRSDGRELVYEAVPRRSRELESEKVRRWGLRVSGQTPSELLEADGNESDEPRSDRDLFAQLSGHPAFRISSEDFLTEYLPLSLSPTGRYAILGVYKNRIPAGWRDYQDRLLHGYVVEDREPGTISNVTQYMLLDTRERNLKPIVDAPQAWQNLGVAWSSNGTSAVLSGTYLPLDTDRDGVRSRQPFVIEFDVRRNAVTAITSDDLGVSRWDSRANRLELKGSSSASANPVITFAKENGTWYRIVSSNQSARMEPFDVVIDQGLNDPPKLFVKNLTSGAKSLLLDPNPQFTHLAFGKVEAVSWLASDGHRVNGGLYYPPDYVAGTRYPLVIQTHGFSKEEFWIDGPFPSAFAAQPLASKGMMVLQVGSAVDPAGDRLAANTPKEAPRQLAAFAGAIDDLESRGLIDRTKVGIIGFSRRVYHAEYALTHAPGLFAAASLVDGFDGGYLNYLFWRSSDYLNVNGGEPAGLGMDLWLKNSPGFSMDQVRAPVRLEYYGPTGVLGAWQCYSELRTLKKPVDFIWIPNGTHLLVKPWDRWVSLEGTVEWFGFWLKREQYAEGSEEQYGRWRRMRESVAGMGADAPQR